METKPNWEKELQQKYKLAISNAFILTGNIGDYVNNKKFLKDYLVQDFLINSEMKMDKIYFFDINSGGICVKDKKNNTENKSCDLNNIIEYMKDETSRNAFIFFYPEYLIPAGDFLQENDKKRIVSMHSALNSYNFLSSNNLVIFITESISNINSMFLGGNCKTTVINIELPNYKERLSFINNNKNDYNINNTISSEVFSRLTAGLQYMAIEDILLVADRVGYLNEKLVLLKKQEIIKKEFGEIIELFDTEGYSLNDFAGQDNIKAYFKEVIIDTIKSKNPEDKDIIPKGVMLMGPPGTGKTYFSRCLAGDAGINFVEFKMSKILGKYVGESEKSMEKALSVFRALAPVGVFMDEIDQSFHRGDNESSSVNSNLFGMLLAEMSKPENRGEIIWLAATNYPNNVDEALKRAGRFDKKIPFFAPTFEERKAVFKLHLNKKGLKLSDDIDLNVLADKTEGYTQAEIEGIVVKALELTKRAKEKEFKMTKLNLALEYMLSAQNNNVKEMEEIALKECNDQEFIPLKYKERHKKLMTCSENFGELNRANNSR